MALTNEDLLAIAQLLQPIQNDLQDFKQSVTDDMQDFKQSVTTDLQDFKQSITVDMQELRQSTKADLQDVKTDLQDFKQSITVDMQELRQSTKADLRELEERLTKLVDERVSKSENLLLEEMGRQFNYFDKEIDKSKSSLQKLSEDVNTLRYSNETVERLLQETLELRERIEKLENRIA